MPAHERLALAQSGGQAALLARIAQRCCQWSERWFPDSFAIAVLVVLIVVAAALCNGATLSRVVVSFGDGFWTLIPFTMQMVFIIVGGFVTADSPPIARLTRRLAAVPSSPRAAVLMVAVFGMLLSLLHWGLSLIMASLLVRALAARTDLRLDYRAAGAAAYLGVSTVWAMGLSSSAAQLQANPASMSPALLAITGVIPFSETIFLWQSFALTVVLAVVSGWIAWQTTPSADKACTAAELGIDLQPTRQPIARSRPGEWLEFNPLLNVLLATLGAAWLYHEFASKGVTAAISNLNTYNFIFLMFGLLLQWRPRNFLDAVTRSVPSVTGVLIQFPLYAGIGALLTGAINGEGVSLATMLAHAFTQFTNSHSFAVVIGAYSAVLGFLVPSGGGKWVIEAPYVMQVANDLHYHLGWTVQIYNAAEALPNLINPFWMLPVLGILKLKAHDLIGFTFVQFIVHVPLVLFLLWLLGTTLAYHPPVQPG
jgi:short-chain fatty acids transporter